MKSFSPLFDDLVQALQALPGVGPRSAQRMALTLLQKKRSQASALSSALEKAIDAIGECKLCGVLSETEICTLCVDPERSDEHLLVVENPAQLLAFERAGLHSGRYFVLKGLISPLDGLGPTDVGIDRLLERASSATELTLAFSGSIEGEATAQYIASQLSGVRITRLARGVPMGSDLESLYPSTLSLAMGARDVF